MNERFPREEKLKNERKINLLFREGRWISCRKLKIIHHSTDRQQHFQIAVSVPKKYFKKSTDRNRIKRLLRESYRKNKSLFRGVLGERSFVMLFYTSYTMPRKYKDVERLVQLLLRRETYSQE